LFLAVTFASHRHTFGRHPCEGKGLDISKPMAIVSCLRKKDGWGAGRRMGAGKVFINQTKKAPLLAP